MDKNMKMNIKITILLLGVSFYTIPYCHGQMRSNNVLWKYKTKGKIIGSATIVGHSLYFGSSDGIVHDLNIRNGKSIWSYRTGGKLASKPEVKNGILYILSGNGWFYALKRDTGHLLWKFQTGGEHRFVRKTSSGKRYDDIWDYYLSGAKVDYGKVYFGSSDGNVYCLNARTGKLIWKFKTDNVIHASPLLRNQKLFIGSFDGYFYALNAENGNLIWKFNTIGERYFPVGAVQKRASFYNGAVYFGSRDFNIYALNANNGHGFWNYREPGSWIIATPTIYKGQVYFGTSDSHSFYSMNAVSGKVNWKLNLNMRVYGSAVGYGQDIYFGCFNGFLYGVNIDTGKINWRFQTDGSRKRYHTIYNSDGTFRSDFSIYGKTLQETRENEAKIQSLGSIMATPVIQNKTLFFGGTDSTFYAVKITD